MTSAHTAVPGRTRLTTSPASADHHGALAELLDPAATAGLVGLRSRAGTTCLDAGAGEGSIARRLAVEGAQVTATEIKPGHIPPHPRLAALLAPERVLLVECGLVDVVITISAQYWNGGGFGSRITAATLEQLRPRLLAAGMTAAQLGRLAALPTDSGLIIHRHPLYFHQRSPPCIGFQLTWTARVPCCALAYLWPK